MPWNAIPLLIVAICLLLKITGTTDDSADTR